MLHGSSIVTAYKSDFFIFLDQTLPWKIKRSLNFHWKITRVQSRYYNFIKTRCTTVNLGLFWSVTLLLSKSTLILFCNGFTLCNERENKCNISFYIFCKYKHLYEHSNSFFEKKPAMDLKIVVFPLNRNDRLKPQVRFLLLFYTLWRKCIKFLIRAFNDFHERNSRKSH